MSHSDVGPADEPMDEVAFQAALTYLLGEAHEHGIDVAGNWSCATHEALPDWEVEVFDVTPPR